MDLFWLQIQPSFYGFMYAISFWVCYYMIRQKKKLFIHHLDDLFFYVFLGVIIWGRLGYVLFYNFSYYIEHPLEILMIWSGGMSFHGWALGVIIALYIFSRVKNISFLMLSDEIARVVPVGLFFGRIGNYVNKELLWFPYTWPLAVQTPVGSFFPSPLLEAFLEWIVLFFILSYFYNKKQSPWSKIQHGYIAALFLLWYGVFRIFVEVFFRTPDAHIGYILPYISTGTTLSIVMVVVGGYFCIRFKK